MNLVIIGGSGHWAEITHYPAVLGKVATDLNVRVLGICDPVDPYVQLGEHFAEGRECLRKILDRDQPLWIRPDASVWWRLDRLHHEHCVHGVIVASNPTSHAEYCEWAIAHGIHVLCDKPLVVLPCASLDISQAELISHVFHRLMEGVRAEERRNPNYTFATPLRRRFLRAFVDMAHAITDIYDRTGEGISHIQVIINGGIHRFPAEFLKGGAHGYLDGVGSLSHSCFHYIDVISWMLRCAPDDLSRIEVSLPYIGRVRDYLGRSGYRRLATLIQSGPVTEDLELPENVLAAELDFTACLRLFNQRNMLVGLVWLIVNHSTFTPRTVPYDPAMLDPANHARGGRMSQVYIDLHQGPLQNLQLRKNDVVYEGHHVELTRRLHPSLGKAFERRVYTDAYNSHGCDPVDLVVSFLRRCCGKEIPSAHESQLRIADEDMLAHEIFARCYELIASEHSGKTRSVMIKVPWANGPDGL